MAFATLFERCRYSTGRIPLRAAAMMALVVLTLAGPGDRTSTAQAAGPASKKAKVELPHPEGTPSKRVAVSNGPEDYHSKRFLIHTDLSPKEAHELLNRLEKMLDLIAAYWARPPQGIIECYVVKDLKNWPAASLGGPGLEKIRQGAGITMVQTAGIGGKIVAAKAIVYAVADHGTPQHEAVHAYCGQAFGRTGPLWYAEGMAEMGQYWQQGDNSVHCHPGVIEYLRSQRPKPLAEILAEEGGGNAGAPAAFTGDSWQNYAWRWALCHLMVNNPNYNKRFAPLGLGLLNNQRVTFQDVYGAVMDEVDFEYRFFLEHVDEGYRVDLCGWDWKQKFREPTGSASMSKRVSAHHGWQASGLQVTAGKKYEYTASGTWQTAKDNPETTADGAPDGGGRLEAVLLHDMQLGEPISLGAYGSFVAPADGKLYLRCHDHWNELADNKGTMNVKLKVAGEGNPLPRPTRSSKEPKTDRGESEAAQPKTGQSKTGKPEKSPPEAAKPRATKS